MGIGGMDDESAKGSLLYTEEGEWGFRTDAVLCVRRWFEVVLAVMAVILESRNQSGAPSISSMSDAKGSRATRGVAAGCGGLGPRGCFSIVSGFEMRRFLGVSGAGSAKGSFPILLLRTGSSVIPMNGDCEDTLLFFLRSTFRSLFLLDMRRTPPTAKCPCGSLIDRPRPLDVVEYIEPTLGRGSCR
jgi:hypothetical protein